MGGVPCAGGVPANSRLRLARLCNDSRYSTLISLRSSFFCLSRRVFPSFFSIFFCCRRSALWSRLVPVPCTAWSNPTVRGLGTGVGSWGTGMGGWETWRPPLCHARCRWLGLGPSVPPWGRPLWLGPTVKLTRLSSYRPKSSIPELTGSSHLSAFHRELGQCCGCRGSLLCIFQTVQSLSSLRASCITNP